MMAAEVANILGILGVILLLIAFFLLQYDKLTPHSILYILANLIGSLLILYSLFYNWNLPAVVIEIAWAAISIYGIYRWFKLKH
jgi:hypothetical protein